MTPSSFAHVSKAMNYIEIEPVSCTPLTRIKVDAMATFCQPNCGGVLGACSSRVDCRPVISRRNDLMELDKEERERREIFPDVCLFVSPWVLAALQKRA